MEKKNILINGEKLSIPAYYQQVKSEPGDPDNSIPLVVNTEYARCIAFASPVDYSKALPRKQEDLIDGIRSYLADNQGLIKVVSEKDYVYSIVKNLKEPHGVQYILSYQRFCKDFILFVQAFFEEMGTTGLRDSMIFSLMKKEGKVGTKEDPFAGWTRDPYDETYRKGALMNISESEVFDEKFPGFPLTLCRELIDCITSE